MDNPYLLFSTLVEQGTFRAAAEALNTSTSSVSRQLQQLEAHLGTQLLQRTTRSFSLTQAGQIYYGSCRRILEELRQTEQQMQNLSSTPFGLLRVTTTPAFGHARLIDILAEFARCYPKINVDLILTDTNIDIVKEGIDIAIRIGQLPDSALIAKTVLEGYRVPCAAPSYLAERGEPTTLDDLQHHDLVYPTSLGSITKIQQAIAPDLVIQDAQKKFSANDINCVYKACLKGLGITFLPSYLVEEDLQSGTLVELFGGKLRSPHIVNAVYPKTAFLANKTRVFVDFICRYFD
ncbi:MAG: LysR family transcriptional regulator [Pseudomonadales bacterium]|nr:LysR family transcriptional regulator [Pseudomonadales bacterium]